MASNVAGEVSSRNVVNRAFPRSLERLRAVFQNSEAGASFEAASPVSKMFHDRIMQLVSLPHSTKAFSSFREVALAFEADWKTLTTYRSDWMTLLQAVVQIKLDTSGTIPSIAESGAMEAARKWRSELLNGLEWPLSIRSKLDASLAALAITESQRVLSDNIRDAVGVMANHMTHQLNELVDRCVLGEIQWYGDAACQYSFVDRSLDPKIDHAGFVGAVRIEDDARVARRTFETKMSAAKKVSVHIHDLADAVSSSVGHATTKIPPHVMQLILTVPQHLRDKLKIVEGNLIRERLMELDQGVEEWAVAEDVTVPFQFDPAVVLADKYVLIGWLDKPKEVTEESMPSISEAVQRFINKLFQ